MRNIIKITLILGASVMMTSCFDKSAPNYQYMPNMYESVAYETNGEAKVFKGGKVGQLPAAGAIKRGFVPYDYPNTTEGYNAAKAGSASPLAPLNEKEMETTKGLFEIYCAICHGNTGDGKGKLATQGKFLGVPNYKDRVITEGSIFHVETYGFNAMGSHANQLSTKERWMIAQYVMKLKNQ